MSISAGLTSNLSSGRVNGGATLQLIARRLMKLVEVNQPSRDLRLGCSRSVFSGLIVGAQPGRAADVSDTGHTPPILWLAIGTVHGDGARYLDSVGLFRAVSPGGRRVCRETE